MAYKSLFSDEEVTEGEYRDQLAIVANGHIRDFDPGKPMRTLDLKERIRYATLNTGIAYDRRSRRRHFYATAKEIAELGGISYSTLTSYYKGRTETPLWAFAKVLDACYSWIYEPEKMLGEVPEDWGQPDEKFPDDIPEHEKRLRVARCLLGIAPEEAEARRAAADHKCEELSERAFRVAYISLMATIAGEEELDFLTSAANYSNRMGGKSTLPERWGGTGVRLLYEKLGQRMPPEEVQRYQTRYERATDENGKRVSHRYIDPESIDRFNFIRLFDLAVKDGDFSLMCALRLAAPPDSCPVVLLDQATLLLPDDMLAP